MAKYMIVGAALSSAGMGMAGVSMPDSPNAGTIQLREVEGVDNAAVSGAGTGTMYVRDVTAYPLSQFVSLGAASVS